MSHVMCHVSRATRHKSRVTCHMIRFRTKWWSLSVKGLLSTGPTPPSFLNRLIPEGKCTLYSKYLGEVFFLKGELLFSSVEIDNFGVGLQIKCPMSRLKRGFRVYFYLYAPDFPKSTTKRLWCTKLGKRPGFKCFTATRIFGCNGTPLQLWNALTPKWVELLRTFFLNEYLCKSVCFSKKSLTCLGVRAFQSCQGVWPFMWVVMLC